MCEALPYGATSAPPGARLRLTVNAPGGACVHLEWRPPGDVPEPSVPEEVPPLEPETPPVPPAEEPPGPGEVPGPTPESAAAPFTVACAGERAG